MQKQGNLSQPATIYSGEGTQIVYFGKSIHERGREEILHSNFCSTKQTIAVKYTPVPKVKVRTGQKRTHWKPQILIRFRDFHLFRSIQTSKEEGTKKKEGTKEKEERKATQKEHRIKGGKGREVTSECLVAGP